MAYTSHYKGTDTRRGPSQAIWSEFDFAAWQADPALGIHFFDDFLQLRTFASATEEDGYITYQDTGGTIQVPAATVDAPGGVLEFTNDGTDEDSVSLSFAQTIAGTEPFRFALDNYGKLFFEARIRITSAALGATGLFVGLAEAAMNADGTANVGLTDANGVPGAQMDCMGWLCPHAASTCVFDLVHQKTAQSLVTNVSDAHTAVLSTWVKLGFIYDPFSIYNYGAPYIRGFVNGALAGGAAISASSTTFPDDVFCQPILYLKNTTAVAKICQLDWWRVAQLGGSGF